MVRTIITPENTTIRLTIPKKYVGKPIEISYRIIEDSESNIPKKSMAEFWNCISDETADKLRAEIKENRK